MLSSLPMRARWIVSTELDTDASVWLKSVCSKRHSSDSVGDGALP